MRSYITKSPRETQSLAKKLAPSLKNGVWILSGDLGGGKTTFIQGIIRSLGYKKRVVSPTFVLMKVYPIKTGKICHIDAYRIKNPRDLLGLGAAEYFKDKKCLVLIEWGEKMESILPRHKKITFKVIDENSRKITIS